MVHQRLELQTSVHGNMDKRSHRLGAQMTKFILKFLHTLSLTLLISGCATAISLSQGSVPYRQDEKQIVDEQGAVGDGNPTSWTAIWQAYGSKTKAAWRTALCVLMAIVITISVASIAQA